MVWTPGHKTQNSNAGSSSSSSGAIMADTSAHHQADVVTQQKVVLAVYAFDQSFIHLVSCVAVQHHQRPVSLKAPQNVEC
jgi:hypothetical protein